MTDRTVEAAGSGVRPRSVRDELVRRRIAEVLDQQVARTGRDRLEILDAGGGTGQMAVPIAALGHRVVVVDPSPDSLAALQRRAAEAGVSDRIQPLPGGATEVHSAVGAGTVDVALCHNVLEYVDDMAAALDAIAATLNDDGALSLIGAGRPAGVLAKALTGHVEEALLAIGEPAADGPAADGPDAPAAAGPAAAGSADAGVPRRFTWAELEELVSAAGMRPVERRGLRVVTDLVPGSTVEDPHRIDALLRLEERAGADPDLRPIAALLHLVARPAG